MTDLDHEPGGDTPGHADPFRVLVETAPVAMGQLDLDRRALSYVNERWRELTGVDDPLPIPFSGLRSIIHPDDLDPTGRIFARAVTERTPFTTDTRIMHPTGAVRHVRFEFAPVTDSAGNVIAYTGAMLDMTELVEATEARRRSEHRYRHLVEDAPVAQVVAELDGTLVEVNNAFVRMMGSTRESLFARRPSELFHPDDLPVLAEQLERLVNGDVDYFEAERRMVRDDGTIVWVSGGTTILGEGRTRYLHSVLQDVTERRLAEDALRESETRFRALADSLPLGVFRSSVDGKLQYVNQQWSDITRVPAEDAVGRGTLELVHPDDLDRIAMARERQAMSRGSFAQQFRIVVPDGATRWVSVHAASAIDPVTDELTGFIGSMEDITPLVAAQEEMARLAGIVEVTSDMVGVADAETGQMQYLNRAARELLGYENADIAGLTALDLYAPETHDAWSDVVAPTLLQGGTWSGELAMRTADGATVPVWQTIAAKRRPDGRMTQISAVGRDITERRRFEAALAHQATHDALTDLPNRALLLDHLGLSLAWAERAPTGVALLFLDLDRFKSINDTFGHETGDELLVAVAGRLSEVLRPSDTVARLGGDEFVILCEDVVDEHHAVAVAQRVLSLIESKPFAVQGSEIDLTASIGIAISAGGDDADPESLLRDADAAMYRAKDLGRARLELFDESMRRRSAERLQLADELATALDRGEIVLHYQPCVCLETGRITAVEALARWNHPQRGLLGPSDFIELAEETGLIVGLGLRVLTEACSQARRWADGLGPDAPRVHVNLSARQLTAANLAVLVRRVLETAGLAPERLCLEITESVLMEDAPAVIEALRRLKDIGIKLAIDDFGTGYSSLSYLRRFPVDVLKVDQTFIDGLGPDPEDSAIVAAIVNLAETLELEAIAEGVETTEQLELLRALGCAGAQGFLLAVPAAPEEITPLLLRSDPRSARRTIRGCRRLTDVRTRATRSSRCGTARRTGRWRAPARHGCRARGGGRH